MKWDDVGYLVLKNRYNEKSVDYTIISYHESSPDDKSEIKGSIAKSRKTKRKTKRKRRIKRKSSGKTRKTRKSSRRTLKKISK